jgi:hypothetical protein
MSLFEQVRLASCRTSGEAQLLRATFAQEGIFVEIRGAQLADKLPLPDVEVTLWVDPRDEHRARALLERLETQRPEPWRCAGCGEDNPGNFETCWRCQAVLART